VFGLFLKMHGRLAVVVGGGEVGRRKLKALRAGGANVRVVCLEARAYEDDGVEWLTQPYEARHLGGASLAIAAATREVNARVVADARGVASGCVTRPTPTTATSSRPRRSRAATSGSPSRPACRP